jgi:hypothetical protein
VRSARVVVLDILYDLANPPAAIASPANTRTAELHAGKTMAKRLAPMLSGDATTEGQDSSTAELIRRYRAGRGR